MSLCNKYADNSSEFYKKYHSYSIKTKHFLQHKKKIDFYIFQNNIIQLIKIVKQE